MSEGLQSEDARTRDRRFEDAAGAKPTRNAPLTDEELAVLGLFSVEGIGPATLESLRAAFGSLAEALRAPRDRLVPLLRDDGTRARLLAAGDLAALALRNLERAGIEAYVYVMLGTPGETEEDAEATLRFLEEHAGGIGFLNLAIMNLPRDARLLEKPGEYGIREAALLAEEEPLGLYQSFEPEGDWGRTEARRFLNSRLLGSASIKQVVNRTPPFFTSNHAFFFPSPKGQPQAAGESP